MNTRQVAVAALLAAGCVVAGTMCLGGCESMGSSKSSMMEKKPLYDRLGGEPAIRAVVDDFVGRAAGDPAVNFTRAGTGHEWAATNANVKHLKEMLVQFIGMATGGPQKYMGKDMKSAHAGMMITEAQFNALAGDLKMSLDHLKVPMAERDELLAVVATTKKDIVAY